MLSILTPPHDTVWRIKDTATNLYVKSGRGRANNTRSFWSTKGAAMCAYRYLPGQIRPDCVLVECEIKEIRTVQPDLGDLNEKISDHRD